MDDDDMITELSEKMSKLSIDPSSDTFIDDENSASGGAVGYAASASASSSETMQSNQPESRKRQRRHTTRVYPDEQDFKILSSGLLWDIGRVNEEIDKMTEEELRNRLRNLNLTFLGAKDVLQRRLKHHVRSERLSAAFLKDPEEVPYFHLMALDCAAAYSDEPASEGEMIEFSTVLIDVKNLRVISSFKQYIQPDLYFTQSDSRTRAKGIRKRNMAQEAMDFPEVMAGFDRWLANWGLESLGDVCIVTEGVWDMRKLLYNQCLRSGVPYPWWGLTWVNLRKIFYDFYGVGYVSLQSMMAHLGLSISARPNFGMHDARSIARIVVQMMRDGCCVKANEWIDMPVPQPPARHSLLVSSYTAGESFASAPTIEEEEEDANKADDGDTTTDTSNKTEMPLRCPKSLFDMASFALRKAHCKALLDMYDIPVAATDHTEASDDDSTCAAAFSNTFTSINTSADMAFCTMTTWANTPAHKFDAGDAAFTSGCGKPFSTNSASAYMPVDPAINKAPAGDGNTSPNMSVEESDDDCDTSANRKVAADGDSARASALGNKTSTSSADISACDGGTEL